jgi:hypothetical protein
MLFYTRNLFCSAAGYLQSKELAVQELTRTWCNK